MSFVILLPSSYTMYMSGYLLLPLDFLKFWYIDAPVQMLRFFGSFNHAFFQLFSLPLLLKTFFKPLKNEYRKGLVGFSIGMGMAVKSALILADFFLLLVFLFVELSIFLLFLIFPLLTVGMFFLNL